MRNAVLLTLGLSVIHLIIGEMVVNAEKDVLKALCRIVHVAQLETALV